jgi:hypothetical protein
MAPTALEALRAGAAYFVDEDGHRLPGLPEEQLLMGACWAHLRDGSTGTWHVVQMQQASELAQPAILAMLLPFPYPSSLENA